MDGSDTSISYHNDPFRCVKAEMLAVAGAPLAALLGNGAFA